MNDLTLDTASVAYQRRSVTSIMLHVIVALIPGITLYTLLVDSRLVINLIIAIASALLFEAIFVMLRKRAVLDSVKDASAALAAILLVLSVPQSLPVWQLIFGVFIMCALGKHVFGGLGHNPFNPAMVAYAVLIVSFPLTMTQWTTERGLLDANPRNSIDETTFATEADKDWNGVTRATPLDRLDTLQRQYAARLKNTTASNTTAPSIDSAQNSSVAGVVTDVVTGESTHHQTIRLIVQSDWFWMSCSWLAGGLYLLFMRIISWRIPVALLTTIWALYALHGLSASGPMLPATVALFSGAIMLGAFFIATDPVSCATSNSGKLVYATGIGALCFFIREFSAYPEGIAFAVLLMNMCVPLIDHAFTRDRLKTHGTKQPRDKGPTL